MGQIHRQHRRIEATGGEPTARDVFVRRGPASVLAFAIEVALGTAAALVLLHLSGVL